jgi:aminoglycoside 3-N-acetyltransferase
LSEWDVIQQTKIPLTVDLLAEQLAACGLAAGQTVLVHSAMSKIGWVNGGPEAVIRALLRVLGPDGTLMMPTHTSGRTDPARWQNPPVPPEWIPVIRATMPVFDPAITPTREMGATAELFRTWPGALRSNHPIGSFAARGPNADYLTEGHSLEDMFGESSPLGKLYALDGHVLLLGVGHGNNTSLHLAENRANWPGKRVIIEGTAMQVDGAPKWIYFEMLQLETDDFETIGDAFESAQGLTPGKVGNAEVRLFRQRPIVDFAVEWMERNRDFTKLNA